MKIQLVPLWTDLLIYLLLIAIIVFIIISKRTKHLRETWQRVFHRKLGMIAMVFLIVFSVIGLLDSIHFRVLTKNVTDSVRSQQVQSIFDVLIRPLGLNNEQTYSAPFSLYSSSKVTIIENGITKTIYPRLTYAGWNLQDPNKKATDITTKTMLSIGLALLIILPFSLLIIYLFAYRHKISMVTAFKQLAHGKTRVAWREILSTLAFVILIACFIGLLSPYYHILGTDKIGNDILYETLKSIRTGLVIGTITTLVMLPFAVLFGMEAGYYGGWRDDIIQYVYTTLSSVPGVLLISASVLSLQVFIANHDQFFPTLESRADARLLALCLILGITSWTTLCRLLRAETLKLREMDYVKAAVTMGVINLKILWRHIFPNVMHIILITVVLDFSALVLAEAVLSYVGVGVDPITPSWGNMINSGRLDLAREPVVWWPLFAAFIFMFVLVLSANLFADAVSDAFNPRLRNEN